MGAERIFRSRTYLMKQNLFSFSVKPSHFLPPQPSNALDSSETTSAGGEVANSDLDSVLAYLLAARGEDDLYSEAERLRQAQVRITCILQIPCSGKM